MFKLESYITPILLNYVAKYVKDLRDEDAQVSLWEGEVSFQNLDLRLDVLEEELNLPIELVSGHIHELSIQVPWTKLTSEPVRIEINTIEFVAKLPNDESKKRRASLLLEKQRKRNSGVTEEQQGTASPSGMVLKIINNINLQCHNIILKYVDDDIVVSMNVQYLNFSAADEKWEPAMVDVNPVQVLLRKLLQVSDLTICLDKRNTAGRIEVCQEPILYRCTLELRVLLKHNAQTVSTSSTVRIGVFTKSLDINVSSLQLPMVMRLVKMLLELKPRESEENLFSLDKPEAPAGVGGINIAPINDATKGSIFLRAWNLLPSFDSSGSESKEPVGHAFDVGIYAEELNFQLKNSELITDQAMGGMKRIRYTPIMRISLGGLYFERSQLKESNWANMRAGLSSILMEPLGIYRSDDPIDRNVMDTKQVQNYRSFVDKSLFDEQYKFADRVWCSHNHDDYFARNTDEYMLFRSPVLAFDIVECRSPKPSKGQVSSEAHFGNSGLRVKYRVLSAGITFHFSQSFEQVKNIISDLFRPYDYTGYTAESRNDPIETSSINTSSSPVSQLQEDIKKDQYLTYADFEYLVDFMPTANYKIELRDITLRFYPRQQSTESSTLANQHRLSITVNQSLLPYLEMTISHAEGSINGPVNPQRLVQLMKYLPDKPRDVIDACCYIHNFSVKNLSLTAHNLTPAMGQAKILNVPSMQVHFKRQIPATHWPPNATPLEQADIQTELFNIEFSKRELILLSNMIPLISSYNGAQLSALAKMVTETQNSTDVIKLQTLITKVRLDYVKYNSHLAALLSLHNLNTDVYHTVMNVRNVVVSTNQGSNNKWAELQLQLPLQDSERSIKQVATAICLWLDNFHVTIDVYLIQFLNSFVNPVQCIENDSETEFDSFSQSERLPSYSSIPSVPKLTQSEVHVRRVSRTNSRKISNPAETIHASSERDDKPLQTEPAKLMPDVESKSDDAMNLVQLMKRLSSIVVFLELNAISIDVSEVMLRRSSKEAQAECTSIALSRMRIKSSNGEDVQRGNIRTIINVNNEAELCIWVMELTDLSASCQTDEKTDVIAEPVRTTITLALSHKTAEEVRPMKSSQPLQQDVIENSTKNDEMKQPQPLVDNYSVNVHVDMSSINFFGRHLSLLYIHCSILNAVFNSLCSLRVTTCVNINECKNHLEVYTGSAQSVSILKEFLELNPNVESSDRKIGGKPKATLIFFCQWTIPRISVEMETSSEEKNRKLLLSFEDLLLNVDKHEDFTKITTKLENVSLNYYEATQEEEWRLMDDFHIKMLGDSTNLPLINVVVTTVNLQDLYSKIGARNLNNKRRTISELLIDIQPIEMVLHVDRITEFLVSQCELFDILCRKPTVPANANEMEVVRDCLTTVQEMPIVHLNSKGIYIYVPVDTDKKCCTVLLLRIESIKLTPSVENPLVRQPVRQDIYIKAAELNMLSTPGALVEDRQYELSVRMISLSSGNWLQTKKFRLEESLSNKYSNPALEWNSQSRSTELEQLDIFKNFDFITVFAPAISYENFLICGESVEFNCATDIIATLNTHQIQMISCIMNRVQVWKSLLGQPCLSTCEQPINASRANRSSISDESRVQTAVSQTYRSKLRSQWKKETAFGKFVDAKSSDSFVGSCRTDSGIHIARNAVGTQGQKLTQSDLKKVSTGRVINHKARLPRSVSFVAGQFTLKIFDVLETEERLRLRPLVLLTISQPSFMAAQMPRTCTTQASVFNFKINVPNSETEREFFDCDDAFNAQFSEPVLDTHPGILGSSGIPPPLFNMKTQVDRVWQVEMDMELRKPIELNLNESNIQLLASDLIRIYSLLCSTPYFAPRNSRPVVHTTAMRQLKLQCFNADRLNVACDRITVKFFNPLEDYSCGIVCRDLSAHIKFSGGPQKAAVKSTLGCIYMEAGDNIFLHPLLLRLSADLLSETWCDQLLSSINLKLNVLHIDASIKNILHLSNANKAMERIRDHANQQWQQFLQHRPMLGRPPDCPATERFKYKPEPAAVVRSKTSQKTKMEFYQDDLRAGAFQFVDVKTETVLPMPYQVQIIKKNYGIICWRYPQPRQMTNIYIYPVPMPVENPIHIKCRMEYFSDTHETFLHYCNFELSENDTKRLTPPDRNICATIWRVVIMQSLISVDGTCFEAEEDEEIHLVDSSPLMRQVKGNADNDFILNPRVLVGCMRIDTIFKAEMVPKVQLLLSCQYIEVNFLNQPNASSMLPPPIKKYFLASKTTTNQTFLTTTMDELRLHTLVYERNNYSAEVNFRSRVKCLDYSSLNMMDIMEPMSFHSYLTFNGFKRSLNANFVLDKLRFNCGPCVIHTLLSSKQHWLELLQQRDVVHTLIPRCMIVNRMQTPFVFGQTGTSERISLMPQELRPYYFCNDGYGQELTFYIENMDTRQLDISETLTVALKFDDEYRIHHLRIGQQCITIKLKKLSATQVYILVKGQIEVVSMVPFELLTEFRTENKTLDDQASNSLANLLAAKGRVSFYKNVMRNADITMRLKLSSNLAKGRTGDIPLKSNGSLPWLVKVPTQSPQQFISVWVRILREDMERFPNIDKDYKPQRILVTIWPIFEICNLLNCDLQATEGSTEEHFIIPKEGGRYALSTPTTHSSEHCVKFDFPCKLGPASQCEYTFMLKSMDWHKFFHYDPADWTIERTLDKLDKTVKSRWPLDDAEELRVRRPHELLSLMDVQYRAQATREFSCTLGLEIAAWGMIINDTSLDVSIRSVADGVRHNIRANCLEMLPVLSSHITIDVPSGSNWISSPVVSVEDHQAGAPASGSGRHMLLRANSFLDIVIVDGDNVFRFLIDFKLQDGRRVFKLRSKFVIGNFTDIPLTALPLTMDHKETSSRAEVSKLHASSRVQCLNKSRATQEDSIGISLERFHDLNAHKSKHSSDTAFVYFVSFAKKDNHNISIPIPLTLPFTRRCFNIQDGADSIALMSTLIEKENVFYLNIFKDTSPAVIITNNTSLKLIVAQTSASGNSKVTCTSPEFTGKHFDWNQMIEPYSRCYYTPPQIYANFPDVEFTMCNLSLGLYSDTVACGAQKIQWSKPIRTDKSWKKFLNVPKHGDIKVMICDKHRATRLNIYYIAQQLEFSVKDLRLRLNQPETMQTDNGEPVPKQSTNEHNSKPRQELEDTDCMHLRDDLQTNDRERDYLKTEVCNMYADDVMLAYDDADDRRELHLQLPNLQVDNQLYTSGKYDFPVLLCAQKLYKRTNCLPQVYDLDYRKLSKDDPVSMISFVLYQDDLQLQAVRCQLQPLRVYIEDAYLNQLLDTLIECAPSNCVYTPTAECKQLKLDAGQTCLPEQVVAQALYIAEPLRLNSFVVEPLSLLLSVHTSSRLYIALDHSPLSFSRYERHQILTVPLRFGQSLGLHYLSGAIFGAGWVVGSLEILGSPSGLARSFTTGLRDFISMPVQGLFRGPWGFLVGITQGSASLLKNVTAGTVNSVTKLAGSVARNLDRLTLDSEHIELTEARRRARPQGFAEGLTQGLTGLGISLLGAVGGLAHHTLEARSSVGVLTGLTKGIVGALTKPLSGAAEMLALTGQGVLHTVGFNAMPQQVEPSVTRNVALHTSSYRIWRVLHEKLSNDQLLFFHEITLLLDSQFQPALLYLTSTVLVIMELRCNDLKFISPVSKVDILADREDPSKLYLSLKPEKSNDTEGMKYTNERIISFINASRFHGSSCRDSLSELLRLHDQDQIQDEHLRRQTQCIFFIRPSIGQHLIHYLRLINQTH